MEEEEGLVKGISFIFFLVLLTPITSSWAAVFKLPMEAVKEVFPEAREVEIKNIILTPEEVLKIEKISKLKINDRLVSFYLGKKGGDVLGFAVIDTHIVRTQPETFLLIMDKRGEVKHVEVIAFYEPLEYLLPQKWLNLLIGKGLNDKLRVKVDLPHVTGATMSARAIIEAVRKNLAIYQVVFGKDKP